MSGNYYPINSMIMIEDKTSRDRVSLLNDRAQGGTSVVEGEIEIMIHRRLVKDDWKGLDEALNEKDYDGKGLR